MRFRWLLFLIPLSLNGIPGYHAPWGPASDISYSAPDKPSASNPSLPARAMEGLIYFHQHVISPVDGPRSHFKPSSSNYMLQAIRKYGFTKGYIMGCDRLLRENSAPWVYRTAVIDGQIWKVDQP